MQNIILASGSAARKMILDALHIPYTVIPADIDEKAIRDKNFAVRAEKIARAKVEKIASLHPEAIIIGGDSFGVVNGVEYEKPVDLRDAKRMLQEQSGQNGTFYAGFCYNDPKIGINFSTTEKVHFVFRTFSDSEIASYIAVNPVLTWSGGLFPGGLYGSTMVARVNGSLTGFTIGFPTDLLIPLLRKSGYDVHP